MLHDEKEPKAKSDCSALMAIIHWRHGPRPSSHRQVWTDAARGIERVERVRNPRPRERFCEICIIFT